MLRALGYALRNPAIRWHYKHCAFSYDPKVETPDVGRLRCAAALAKAEAWFAALPPEAKQVQWDEDSDLGGWPTDEECPPPDEVMQLLVTVRLAPPPERQLRAVKMGQGIMRVFIGPAPADDEYKPETHIATFFDEDRAADYIAAVNAPRTYRYSLGCIGMMHATMPVDVRMYEAEAALNLYNEWSAS